MLRVLSRQHGVQQVDLAEDPPSPTMRRHLPANLALRFGVVPWRNIGGALLVATESPAAFHRLQACMANTGMPLLPVIADGAQIRQQISRLYGDELARKAATRVPAHESCRGWSRQGNWRAFWALSALALVLAALALSPLWTLTVAILWAVLTLVMSTTLKAAALLAMLRRPRRTGLQVAHGAPDTFRLPRVSMLVPLLREREIAGALISRLSRLTYPKSLLDVMLVLEEGDTVTRDTLARTDLPPWITVIEVPEANQLTTKPRALNYALDFCQGSIIGVWDAEDAPEPDQIEQVVTRFQQAPPKVACLQGVLDYYNSRSNWLSRCFTIEYASWWRVILPGIARLGLVLPLGGTTLFFRADVLKHLGGWDAHNVTEDADLGVRLARHGYVTELLPTVTFEEANCRAWPWVRQRSRWLKGFLITWCVHMRRPGVLLQDLGLTRFLGVQTMLLATFSQFLCAPLLWSFWLALAGLPHPVGQTLGSEAMWAMAIFFLASEALNLAIAAAGVGRPGHWHLLGWTLSMPLYFPLGTLAAFKAMHEFIRSPFFWDKTQHGLAQPANTLDARPQAPVLLPITGDDIPMPERSWVSVRSNRGREANVNAARTASPAIEQRESVG
jgi:cellulose synthase/poly-beta-1,6-N-acetylglucosamine synthase-like glycosyltransferase